MLQNVSPPGEEKDEQFSVSPLDSCHVSRSSTPGISALDGTPRYLFALATPPSPPRSASAPPMAIKSIRHERYDHPEQSIKVKPIPVVPDGQVSIPSEEPIPASLPLEETNGDHAPSPVRSLPDLSQLLQQEEFHTRKSHQIQRQLYHAHTIAARSARLVHNARQIQYTFANCIKSEDKHSFVNLLNAFHEALLTCSEPPEGDSEDEGTATGDHPVYPASFLDAMPLGLRSAVLHFLDLVRHDGQFLADRIASLTHRELLALLPEKGISKYGDSIFGSSPRANSQGSRYLGFVVDGQTELLSSHDFSCPLDALVHSVREISGQRLAEDTVAMDVWSTVCARLISDQKPGSEKLVPAVIDAWAHFSSWPGKDRLELWLLQRLQKGSFLLDQPNRQSFNMRAQGRSETPAQDDMRRASFYAEAVDSLLDLLADRNGASVIPEGAQKLSHTICEKLQRSPGHQRTFPEFVVTRWLLPFITEAIALPETHGLLLDHFLSENARQHILREVASRCQKIVFDVVYSWKLGTVVPSEATQLVKSVVSRFQNPGSNRDIVPQTAHLSRGDSLIAVSATDVSTLVSALYPPQRPASLSERDLSYSGIRSSASSVSGFSLFQNLAALDPISPASPPRMQDASFPSSLETPVFTAPNGSTPELDGLQTADGEQLREACSAIDDALVNRSSSGSEQWCFLFLDPEDRRLSTVQERISASSKANGVLRDAEIGAEGGLDVLDGPDIHRTLKTDIAELLFDYHLIHVEDRLGHVELQDWFFQAFELRHKECEERSDFVGAHAWFQKLRYFQQYVREGEFPSLLASILDELNLDRSGYLDTALLRIDACGAWLRSVGLCFESFSKELRGRRNTAIHLRDKMWYVAEVRTSAVYDEARSIASALRVMGRPKNTTHAQSVQPLRRWSGLRLSATAESQVLELLCAPSNHGGPNKLNSDQSKALAAWMERNVAENLCRGEERLHKLCMEIRKAVDLLTAEGSTLLSSTLFTKENLQVTPRPQTGSSDPFWSLRGNTRRFDILTLRTDVPPSQDAMSSTSSHALSTRSSRDHLESWSPSVTNRSSNPFWSPAVTEARSPSSATSVGSSQTQAPPTGISRKQRELRSNESSNSIERLRQNVISLLLSDLGSVLFPDGSETDHAFWNGIGGELIGKHFLSLDPNLTGEKPDDTPKDLFDFENALEKMARRFSLSCNPHAKLAQLSDIDALLTPYMANQRCPPLSAARLQPFPPVSVKQSVRSKTSDIKINGFRRLFSNSSIRPQTIFRDLQYIAALVPSSTLETTSQGKAFWNAALALLGLKQEARNLMVETADSIIAFHSNNRGHGRSSSVAQQERDSATFSVPSPTPSAEDIGRYELADAATLLQITAKEGDSVAQRELGTLYLTNPELMDHIIAPLSLPRAVFKEELESKWRKNQDPNRCDPTTMCVAHHWMSLSSKGGDALAKEFLRQRDEMDRLP